MKEIINLIKVLLSLFLMRAGWYSLGYGFTSANGDGNFFFIDGFLLGGAGIALLISVIRKINLFNSATSIEKRHLT